MIDWNKPVQTKDGRPVRIFMTNSGSPFPVLGAIKLREGYFSSQSWTSEGKAYMCEESSTDLINVPERFSIKRWVNVYREVSNEELRPGLLYSSEKEARDNKNLTRGYCGTYKVMIEGEIK